MAMKMVPCRFFAVGACKNGDSCRFSHEQHTSSTSAWNQAELKASALPDKGSLTTTPASSTLLNTGVKTARICKFFGNGLCNRGDSCEYLHASTDTVPSPRVHSNVIALLPSQGAQNLSPRSPLDSRALVPCKFLSFPGGCRNKPCPFSHSTASHEAENGGNQDQDHDDEFTRDLAGALVCFDEFSSILKVSLPTDFSLASITSLAPGTTSQTLVDILRGLGFELEIGCVRVRGHTISSESRATVKVEDPLFARQLCAKLKDHETKLSATPISIDAGVTKSKKVHTSWHKATQSVWINFGNGDIADRVRKRFNEGKYKCLGQPIKASAAEKATSRGGRGGAFNNPLAWTVTLTDVPSNATSKDIEAAIRWEQDKPRHIEMGSASYRACDAEVSVEIRSLLEKHGRLEKFSLLDAPQGKRVKAKAWFEDEADARSACSLNNESLRILANGKLTVTLIQSAKFKIPIAVYNASKARIDTERGIWRERHLFLQIYLDPLQRFITLRIEGDDPKEFATARTMLEKILNGTILKDDEDVIVWAPILNSNGSAYVKLKSIEKDLQVVIVRDKSKRQLRFHGPSEKFQQAVRQISDMLRDECTTSYEIDLDPHKFSHAIQGGFKSLEAVMGKGVCVFSVVSKKITINGTQQQYEKALAVLTENLLSTINPNVAAPSPSDPLCPICLCDAENPVQLSCKHTYCLDCFEGLSGSVASTSDESFHISCQGDGGHCSTIFPLREVEGHLSSSIFESVLTSSFEQHIQRHPEIFRYCPTPSCGFIYRCVTSDTESTTIICASCLEMICRSCHARHGEYTCPEYKDIASGGLEALAKLKKELSIKDCPKCTTPMEKTEGCNHMTCLACKAHICWVCMAAFVTSALCYAHMNEKHGGIGLNLEAYMD